MGPRRRARIVALQTLFEVDTVDHPPEEVLEHSLVETPLPGEAAEYARHLVRGVIQNRAQIDGIIQKAAPAWPLDQMASIDKNILRLAIFELLFNNTSVPAKAAINEAVELAKLFGSDSSSRFINGALGAITPR
ncbi:MAG: transcription antitermination factor NusB [Chloroflexi bacterium]|nr:transcription antitermination factor NusB [Chloroflexota bacterium]MCL5074101.1 transcription antitermination factor NusB [Chloroflexota bacterium]